MSMTTLFKPWKNVVLVSQPTRGHFEGYCLNRKNAKELVFILGMYLSALLLFSRLLLSYSYQAWDSKAQCIKNWNPWPGHNNKKSLHSFHCQGEVARNKDFYFWIDSLKDKKNNLNFKNAYNLFKLIRKQKSIHGFLVWICEE